LAIPKNLVYVFVLIIVGSFLGMLYMTYFATEYEMQAFTTYDRNKEVVVVDPVLESLFKYMNLDKGKIPEIKMDKFNSKEFFDEYLSENRPLIVRQYAAEWPATQKWQDLDYLKETTKG